MYSGADKRLRERINKSLDYKGSPLQPLAKSTLNIRKQRGRGGSRPLIDTGKFLRSIKQVKKGKKIGVEFLAYGLHQAIGFKTNNHFAVKNGRKIVGYRDYSSGVNIPSREWINTDAFPFNAGDGLAAGKKGAKFTKKEAKKIIKSIKKHLKGRVVHRTGELR